MAAMSTSEGAAEDSTAAPDTPGSDVSAPSAGAQMARRSAQKMCRVKEVEDARSAASARVAVARVDTSARLQRRAPALRSQGE